MTDRHKIVFYGEIIEGQNLETVKKNMGILFKMDIDKINRLLSKPPILIKKDIDFPTATKCQEILKKAGAVCKIEPMISEQKTSPVSTQPDENQAKYELVFYGDLVAGQDLITVKKRLANLFKTDISKIDKFLSQQPAIIKRNVDLETASLYREAIMNAGAICIIKPAMSMQKAIPVPTGSVRNSVSTPPSPSQIQKDNAPPSPRPIITQQPPPDSGALQETRSESANSSGSDDKVSDPYGQDKTEKVQTSEQPPQPPSNHLVCSQCHFEQESSNKCVRCGISLQDFCKTVDPTVTPQGNDSEKLSSTEIDQSQGHQSSQHSNSFFKRLFHLIRRNESK